MPGAEAGDRRVLILDGEPIGALLRRNDAGRLHAQPGHRRHRPPLRRRPRPTGPSAAAWPPGCGSAGLWFVGIDLLADRLIEINVTSPTCVQEINRLDGVALERPIVDFLERHAGLATPTPGTG